MISLSSRNPSISRKDYDDRDDFRPLFTLLLCLGASAAAEDEGGRERLQGLQLRA